MCYSKERWNSLHLPMVTAAADGFHYVACADGTRTLARGTWSSRCVGRFLRPNAAMPGRQNTPLGCQFQKGMRFGGHLDPSTRPLNPYQFPYPLWNCWASYRVAHRTPGAPPRPGSVLRFFGRGRTGVGALQVLQPTTLIRPGA